MTVQGIAEALGARRSGSGWKAPCPAHEDGNPSLSISEADGKILLHCHAGCPQAAVIEALRERGLWSEGHAQLEPHQRACGQAKQRTGNRRIVAEYNYTNRSGALLFQVIRFEPKGFCQRYPDGAGGWIWKKHPDQVLYRLPEVLEAPIIFVVEGERDVETLRARGFVATTPAGGASAPWLPGFTETLRGREVVIWPDADGPGRRKALVIARALLGAAARITLLDISGAKDASEWFEQGHSETELIAQVEGEGVAQ